MTVLMSYFFTFGHKNIENLRIKRMPAGFVSIPGPEWLNK